MTERKKVIDALSKVFPPVRMEVVPAGLTWHSPEEVPWGVVVRPRDVDDIARTLRLGRRLGVPVVVGGGTAAHAVPTRGGGVVRIDMTGMDRVIELDPASRLIRVEAGMSMAVLASRLAEHRFFCGWELTTDDPHTLGGILSGVPTRWGARYGSPAAAVRGLVAVLPDGTVYRQCAAPRRACGPDLGRVFLGARGRLGVVVDVTLRVFPWPRAMRTVQWKLAVGAAGALRDAFHAAGTPHWLEAHAPGDGAMIVSLSIHGLPVEVDGRVQRVADILGAAPEALLGRPPLPPCPGSSTQRGRRAVPLPVRLTWTHFERLVASGALGSGGWHADQMTAHGLRLCPVTAGMAQAAVQTLRMGPAVRRRGPSAAMLARLRSALDPDGTLRAEAEL